MNKQKIAGRYHAGMSLVEVVIASAIILLISGSLITANLAYLKTARTNLKVTKAIYLIEEGAEAVNFLKDENWTNLGNLDTDYYLAWTGSAWAATTTNILIDGLYERKFSTTAVNRDSNFDIVTSGGSLDENTRQLLVTVSWPESNATSVKSIVSYLIKENEEN